MENIEIIKFILIGLRQEVIINQGKNKNQLITSINNYMSCVRRSRVFGIKIKDIKKLYFDIDQIIKSKKNLNQLGDLMFKFGEDLNDLN